MNAIPWSVIIELGTHVVLAVVGIIQDANASVAEKRAKISALIVSIKTTRAQVQAVDLTP